MNKRMGWENEATTRAINERPWEPMPGMVKRQCPESAAIGSPHRRGSQGGTLARTVWTSCRAGSGDDQVGTHRGTRHRPSASAGADVELIVTTIFDHITVALAHGGRVELRGFGAFTVKRRNARIGHNPRTGEAVSVPEKPMLFFKAGKRLRYRLNRGGMKRRT